MKLKYVILSLLPLCSLVSCNNVKGDIEFDFNVTEKKEGTKKLSFLVEPSFEYLSPDSNYHVSIHWGDGKSDTLTREDFNKEFDHICSHDYQEAKNYRVKIVGNVSGFSFAEVDKDEIEGRMVILGYTTLFSNDNIYTDNFVVNSFNQLRGLSDYSDIILGGKSTTGDISKMSNVTFNYPISNFFSGFNFDNTSLKTITLPSSLMRITKDDFAGLTTLEAVNLPSDSKLTSIESGAFNGCTSLTNFTIPSYVYKLDGGVFSGCTSLKAVKFTATTPTLITDYTFDYDHLPEKIIVPKGYKDKYVTKWTEEDISETILSKIVEE